MMDLAKWDDPFAIALARIGEACDAEHESHCR
jgi:hypothetical protein